MNLSTNPRYFAASNSAEGFKNYYGDCFSESRVDRLYIIKGGPGTGKSHFMRTVARRAASAGYAVVEYECSSDPASLDGILLTRADSPRIGFLDGTAPHVCEPITPGVREEIINLGAFWDGSRLVGRSTEIRDLSARKSAAYAKAYRYLAAAGEAEAIADTLISPAVKEGRLGALADRLLRGEPSGQGFDLLPALRSAVSMGGRVTRHTFEEMASSLVILDPAYGLGHRVTARLLALSREKHLRVLASYDPVSPAKMDGLFFPDSGFCVLVGDAEPREDCPTRAISLRRYMDSEVWHALRPEVRHALGLRRTLEEDALRALSEAAEVHFALERIYASAMDFGEKEVFCEGFCERLFG